MEFELCLIKKFLDKLFTFLILLTGIGSTGPNLSLKKCFIFKQRLVCKSLRVIVFLFKSKFLSKYTKIYKEDGFKGVFKEGGWRVVGLVTLFFLMKGVLFYIVPYLIVKGIIF